MVAWLGKESRHCRGEPVVEVSRADTLANRETRNLRNMAGDGENMRVGIMADTHIVDGSGISEIPDSVINALRGVDLILHLGDLAGC